MLKYYFKALKATMMLVFLGFFFGLNVFWGFLFASLWDFFQTLGNLDCFTKDTVILNALEEKWLHKD